MLITGQETVIGILCIDPKTYDECDAHADGKAQDVEGAIDLVGDQIAPGGFQIVVEHTDFCRQTCAGRPIRYKSIIYDGVAALGVRFRHMGCLLLKIVA